MSNRGTDQGAASVKVQNREGRGQVLIVCEHASRYIPERYGDLGLQLDLLQSHIAWDPGALPVAQRLSAAFDAPLVSGGVSRLLFDCNRPPEAVDAIPERSEDHIIPGNIDLSEAERNDRVRTIHDPFEAALRQTLDGFSEPPLILTVHSFTPVYKGVSRQVEVGLVHDTDDRLARAMRDRAASHTGLKTALNDPYGPEDGVTHTLRRFALPNGSVNVMLEIRNDLIAETRTQTGMADMLTGWISAACVDLGRPIDTETSQ